MQKLISLFISFLLLYSVSYIVRSLWKNIFKGKKYFILIFPGILIHEISHLIGCIISFAKIKKVDFSPTGGSVKHEKPKLPLIGMPIISFFPTIGGSFFLFFAFKVSNFNLPDPAGYAFMSELINMIIHNWKNPIFWLLVYLSISIVISIIPSKKDFKNSFWGLLITIVFLSLLIMAGLIEKIPFINEVISIIGFSFVAGIFVIPLSLTLLVLKTFFFKAINKLN